MSALPLLIHAAHIGFFYYLDESADTNFSKTWPYFEVACSDDFTPSLCVGIPHFFMVELDDLPRGLTFIIVVGKTFGYGHGS